MNPSTPLRVMLVGTIPGASPPTCDPAIDLDSPNAGAALTAYERSRSPETLAAIPLKPGMQPVLFTVMPLTTRGMCIVSGSGNEASQECASVLIGCHEYMDAKGVTIRAADHGGISEISKGIAYASDDWADYIADTFGFVAIRELASVIRNRAAGGRDAVRGFSLPRGLLLAR